MSSCCRKRKGGIKLEGETVSEPQEEDTGNKQLEEEIAKEVEQKKEELQKKKADDLWSSFMSDVGKVTPKRTTSSSLGSLASLNKVSNWRASTLSQALRFMVGPGHCHMISKYGPSLSKAVGPVDPSILVLKKSHFNKKYSSYNDLNDNW